MYMCTCIMHNCTVIINHQRHRFSHSGCVEFNDIFSINIVLDLRSLIKPSTAIQELLETVIIIVKSPNADLSWTKGAKRLMANIDRFREMLMEFTQNQEVRQLCYIQLNPNVQNNSK